jgi:mRNA interferase MazF
MEGDARVVRGEIWWAAVPGGDRPVLVLTRDAVAERIGAVVVAACTRTVRGLGSELRLGPGDGMPEVCVASFDNLHTVRRELLRARITRLGDQRMREACAALQHALGCGGG